MSAIVCNSCNKEVDLTVRINRPGVDGIFYCEPCLQEHQEQIKQLRAMSREELDLVPYDLVKWVCLGKGCDNGTTERNL